MSIQRSQNVAKAWKLQAKLILRSHTPPRKELSSGETRPLALPQPWGCSEEADTPFGSPPSHRYYGLHFGVLRRSRGPRFPVPAVWPGVGGTRVHALRARLLGQLPAALGGAEAPVPAAVPAAGAGRAVPGAAAAQPGPAAPSAVRLSRSGLQPHGAAVGAGSVRPELHLWP